MKPSLAPPVVSAILAGALVVATRVWLSPGLPAVGTALHTIGGAAIAFVLTAVLSRLTRE